MKGLKCQYETFDRDSAPSPSFRAHRTHFDLINRRERTLLYNLGLGLGPKACALETYAATNRIATIAHLGATDRGIAHTNYADVDILSVSLRKSSAVLDFE